MEKGPENCQKLKKLMKMAKFIGVELSVSLSVKKSGTTFNPLGLKSLED